MTNPLMDAPEWSDWLASKNLVTAKLRGSDRANLESYFLLVHAATEAMLRRILFIGLRLNTVTYKEANDWLYHNDETPDNLKYPILFGNLYANKQVNWNDVIASVPGLDKTWELWLGFSKIIRNHISHGIRKYNHNPGWLICAIHIDQELLIRLDLALEPIIGGSAAGDLTRFNPRLPMGRTGSDLAKITGRKKSKASRPKVSLAHAQNELASLPSCGVIK